METPQVNFKYQNKNELRVDSLHVQDARQNQNEYYKNMKSCHVYVTKEGCSKYDWVFHFIDKYDL